MQKRLPFVPSEQNYTRVFATVLKDILLSFNSCVSIYRYWDKIASTFKLWFKITLSVKKGKYFPEPSPQKPDLKRNQLCLSCRFHSTKGIGSHLVFWAGFTVYSEQLLGSHRVQNPNIISSFALTNKANKVVPTLVRIAANSRAIKTFTPSKYLAAARETRREAKIFLFGLK